MTTNTYTLSTLPNGIAALRTGTANDGRALFAAPPQRLQSVLRDLRARLPSGWTAEVYAPSGADVVISHVG
jgi:hypothetical protein